MKPYIALSATAIAAAGLLSVAGCGSSSNTTSHPAAHSSGSMSTMSPSAPMTTTGGGAPAAGPHNQADVTFATDMIPHHSQAVAMASMAAARATNSEVKALAADIKEAQNPEISQLTGWLHGWGRPVPSMSGMGGSMTGMSGMSGMMSDADMAGLNAASGAAFDRMWVQMMIRHHTGAVSMAKTELSAGNNTAAKVLAQSIVTSQTAQIGQLQALLGQLPTA